MSDDKKKNAGNLEKQVVDGIKVNTYTLNEGHDTLFKIQTEKEIEQNIKDYEEKLQTEAMQKLNKQNNSLEEKLQAELGEENFDSGSVSAEGAADLIKLDPEQIKEKLALISKDDRIVCIGDSITYGFEVEGSQTWIGRLRKEDEINLLNVGLNDDTTSGMVSRFHEHVIDLNAKAVLIMGGGNDIMGGTPVDYVTNNVAMMSQMALNAGIVPMIGIQPEPFHKDVPKEWKVMMDYDAACENIAVYKQWLLVFANANLIPVIDFDTGMKNRLKAGYGRYFMDGVHPSPAGHKIMAAIARDAFISMGILKPKKDLIDEKFSL